MGDSEIDPERLVMVEDEAGDDERPGEWVYTSDRRVRFMALRSEHAAHFLGIHLYRGQRDAPAERLPERAREWVEGTPLAFLIDFLTEDGDVAYRVHYQDAASTPPAGFPPELADGIPVDLVILCPPGSDEVDDYPGGILARLQPRAVLLGHWEDFFRPRSEPPSAVPGTDLESFLRRTEGALPPGANVGMLLPGESVWVNAGP